MNYYFLIKPSNFSRLGEVNIDGEYEEVINTDFSISSDANINSKLNYLIFEVPCKEKGKDILLGKKATEIFTGNKFDIEYYESNEKNGLEAALNCDDIGLFMVDALNVDDMIVEGAKVSGMLKYMKEHEAEYKNYCVSLNQMIEASTFHNDQYNETVLGPSRSTKRELRKGFYRKLR